jgi:Mn2+/Fe2+ NRAMP family transporter
VDIIFGVTARPDLKALPGSNVLQQLVNGAEAWALAIALLGAFVGAALWAVASHTHNHQYAARGRMAALISGASALIVGAAPGLVNFFERLGTTAR